MNMIFFTQQTYHGVPKLVRIDLVSPILSSRYQTVLHIRICSVYWAGHQISSVCDISYFSFNWYILFPNIFVLDNTQQINASFTPNSLGTWDLWAKNCQNNGTWPLVGKIICSSCITHQKVIRYSWILAITRQYSSLKSTTSTIVLTVKNSHGTCWFQSRVTNLQLHPLLVLSSLQVGHNSFGGLYII